jgi:hypothetical protein
MTEIIVIRFTRVGVILFAIDCVTWFKRYITKKRKNK